jgi:hypothetical protein
MGGTAIALIPKGPDQRIGRHSKTLTSVFTTGTAISNAPIDFRGWAGGMFTTPSTMDATTVIGFTVCSDPTGTFLPLYDKTNTLVTVTVTLNASRAYPLPDELFGVPYFKLWTQAAGVDVNQTGAKTFTLSLKG